MRPRASASRRRRAQRPRQPAGRTSRAPSGYCKGRRGPHRGRRQLFARCRSRTGRWTWHRARRERSDRAFADSQAAAQLLERQRDALEVALVPRRADINVLGWPAGAVRRAGEAADQHKLNAMPAERAEDCGRVERRRVRFAHPRPCSRAYLAFSSSTTRRSSSRVARRRRPTWPASTGVSSGRAGGQFALIQPPHSSTDRKRLLSVERASAMRLV